MTFGELRAALGLRPTDRAGLPRASDEIEVTWGHLPDVMQDGQEVVRCRLGRDTGRWFSSFNAGWVCWPVLAVVGGYWLETEEKIGEAEVGRSTESTLVRFFELQPTGVYEALDETSPAVTDAIEAAAAFAAMARA